jgi:glycosyltransferase involved in cell wall biosynthesis
MKLLFLTRKAPPHIGGVEKHIEEVSKVLKRKGHSIQVISEDDIKYPHIKYLGLIYIWLWLFWNRKVIENVDIVHCHDVFIWYLPFRFLYPKKPVYTTFHGWEGVWPIPWKNILLKRIASKYSWGSIAVGMYIGKYYGIKPNKILYGGLSHINKVDKKEKSTCVYIGRLEKDTGVLEFIKWLRKKHFRKVDFVGDGKLRPECKKYGLVHGFKNPTPFLKRAEICVPGGYLTYIEAKQFGCKIEVFPNNPLKKDYWKEIKEVQKFPSWNQIANEYLNLYNHI